MGQGFGAGVDLKSCGHPGAEQRGQRQQLLATAHGLALHLRGERVDGWKGGHFVLKGRNFVFANGEGNCRFPLVSDRVAGRGDPPPSCGVNVTRR